MTDLQIVATYSAFLSGLNIRHLVGGSLASSAWGEQRTTNDADFVVELLPESIGAYVSSLPAGFFVEESELRDAVLSTQPFASFQLLHEPMVFKIDNFTAHGPWEREQLGRAHTLRIWEDVEVPFAGPEDVLIAKCRWFDLGNRASDRQWNDLVRLYEVQGIRLDSSLIERWLTEFELMDLWVEIQTQART